MTSVHTGSGPLSYPFIYPHTERFLVRLQKWTQEHLSILECIGKVAGLSPFTDKKIKAQKNGTY